MGHPFRAPHETLGVRLRMHPRPPGTHPWESTTRGLVLLGPEWPSRMHNENLKDIVVTDFEPRIPALSLDIARFLLSTLAFTQINAHPKEDGDMSCASSRRGQRRL